MTDHQTADAPLRAELYLRGDAHGGLGVQQVVERVRHLVESGTFDDATVVRGWDRCHTRSDDRRSSAMETYEAFRAWAERTGRSLEPGFQQRTRSFVGVDGIEDVVVFPFVTLALYDGDQELGAVFPCSDETRTYTVEAALAAFERGDEEWLTQFDPTGTGRVGSRPVQRNLTAD